MIKGKMELFNTYVSEKSIQLVEDVLRSGWLNEGKYVQLFEKSLSDFGLINPITVNSCTSALHLSLICAGIGPGDEVIIPPQTFIATGIAVLMTGAKPVFCDIDPFTGNIDPYKLPISEQTKAIIPVHWGGLPCQMPKLLDIANKYNIVVIEDAAHAFGSSINGKLIGNWSPFTCFSFQSIKFLTTGDGGLICTTRNDIKEEIIRRKWFGIDKNKLTRHFEGDRNFPVCQLGFKYHMNDITAALGVGNLMDINLRLNKRSNIAAQYKGQLSHIDGIRLLRIDEGYKSSWWLFTILVENRTQFIAKMRSHSIPVSVVDRRIDQNPIFGGITPGLSGQEEFDAYQISIPVHDDLTDDDVNQIINAIHSGW
jgi:perosamine synthetase